MHDWFASRRRTLGLLGSHLAIAGANTGVAIGQTRPPGSRNGKFIGVGNVEQLHEAVKTANRNGGHTTISLNPGRYRVVDTLAITAPGISLNSSTGRRDDVHIEGDAMRASARIGNLIRVSAPHFQLRSVSLGNCGRHAIQIAGESRAHAPVISNCSIRDSHQQLLKVSVDPANPDASADDGLIEGCLFEYSAGMGPQWYIGGVDVHGGKRWTVRRNVFRHIISPSKEVAQFAVHFWNNSADNLVEKNLIMNCDRGIGFGLARRVNFRGVIRNNMIFHEPDLGQYADVGINLERSPGTQVYNNTIFFEHAYRRAIEYRHPESSDLLIVNNLLNRTIARIDGASGIVQNNIASAQSVWFVDAWKGNLRLAGANLPPIDAAIDVPGLGDDFDGYPRPGGSRNDVGAHEWAGRSR